MEWGELASAIYGAAHRTMGFSLGGKIPPFIATNCGSGSTMGMGL
jgi:hypothetical protein